MRAGVQVEANVEEYSECDGALAWLMNEEHSYVDSDDGGVGSLRGPKKGGRVASGLTTGTDCFTSRVSKTVVSCTGISGNGRETRGGVGNGGGGRGGEGRGGAGRGGEGRGGVGKGGAGNGGE